MEYKDLIENYTPEMELIDALDYKLNALNITATLNF